ncbi:MAG: heme o synthase [Trueperaceae bacterium]|nr:heme o synthase [Trueperaceae bacterium]
MNQPLSQTLNSSTVATWRDYITLTKPKVISLLLFTAVGAMFIAAKGFPGWLPLIGMLLGGYMSPGAAGVFNMIYDRDIDERMKRTSKRPTVTAVISTRNALIFGIALAVLSFLVIALTSNLLAAWLSLAGIAFYVGIYTMWLKRSTWQNIVIGGAAGAIPPLVGWAAVTGELNVLAWVLFTLIFMWTPVHFWALALMIKEEYRAVGIPMAPAVIGDKATVRQMLIYAVLTMVTTLIPFFIGEFSWVYSLLALWLNGVLIWRTIKLYKLVNAGKVVDKATALPLYKFSMLYLAILFLVMSLDRAFLL